MPTRPRLHLDADASIKSLYHALRERGHVVTRTPAEWMPLDASEEMQLLGATAQGRCLFAFNVRDLLALARHYPYHAVVVLASQSSWTLTDLIAALDRLLSSTYVDDWPGAVRWSSEWRG